MKQKKLATIALVAAMTIGTLGFSVPVNAVGYTNTTDYTITIPATLEVANAGWNETSGITAKRIDDVESESKYYQFDSSKKLTVTAASANSWKLVSGENNVGYNLATATGDYSSEATPASWEFSADELNAEGGKTNPMGIIVEDYSSKPAGTYQDTVTFTASVVSATKKLTLTGRYDDYNTGEIINNSLEIEYTDNDTWKDIADRYDEVSIQNISLGPEGKIIYFWHDMSQGIDGCQLKSNESTHNYNLVSINDKVSAYSSYFLR